MENEIDLENATLVNSKSAEELLRGGRRHFVKNAKETRYRGYTLRELPEGIQILEGLSEIKLSPSIEKAKEFIDKILD